MIVDNLFARLTGRGRAVPLPSARSGAQYDGAAGGAPTSSTGAPLSNGHAAAVAGQTISVLGDATDAPGPSTGRGLSSSRQGADTLPTGADRPQEDAAASEDNDRLGADGLDATVGSVGAAASGQGTTAASRSQGSPHRRRGVIRTESRHAYAKRRMNTVSNTMRAVERKTEGVYITFLMFNDTNQDGSRKRTMHLEGSHELCTALATRNGNGSWELKPEYEVAALAALMGSRKSEINDLQQPPEQRFRNQPQVARAIGKLAIDLLAEDCGVEAKVIGKQAYGWYKKHRENTQGLPEVPSWFDDTLEFTSSAVYHAPRPRLNALYKAMAAERCNRLAAASAAQQAAAQRRGAVAAAAAAVATAPEPLLGDVEDFSDEEDEDGGYASGGSSSEEEEEEVEQLGAKRRRHDSDAGAADEGGVSTMRRSVPQRKAAKNHLVLGTRGNDCSE